MLSPSHLFGDLVEQFEKIMTDDYKSKLIECIYFKVANSKHGYTNSISFKHN
jgi:hypothetical protein